MRSKALIKAQKKYYEKNKTTDNFKEKVLIYNMNQKKKYHENKEYREKKKEYQKNYYNNKKNIVVY